jgi:dephospho-CoA kinase
MKVLGLTGSIGMGKSVTASLLRRIGVSVHDSDAVVHESLSPGGAAFETVALMFPQVWDKKKRVIDRKKLGDIVFGDDTARAKLESVLHPLVWQSQKKFLLKARRMGLKKVVLDIPLLFETGAERKCDAVMTVTAPFLIQRQRVLRRGGMSEKKFFAILARQIPDIQKRRMSDIVLDTGLGRAFTLRALKSALRKLGKKHHA